VMQDKRGTPKRPQPAVVALVAGVTDDVGFEEDVESMLGDSHYSPPLVMALLALAAFPGDGSTMDMIEAASQFDWPLAATDCYIARWAALGVLERDLASGRYRRALALTRATDRPANTARGAAWGA
jgi:hypothetical protein